MAAFGSRRPGKVRTGTSAPGDQAGQEGGRQKSDEVAPGGTHKMGRSTGTRRKDREAQEPEHQVDQDGRGASNRAQNQAGEYDEEGLEAHRNRCEGQGNAHEGADPDQGGKEADENGPREGPEGVVHSAGQGIKDGQGRQSGGQELPLPAISDINSGMFGTAHVRGRGVSAFGPALVGVFLLFTVLSAYPLEPAVPLTARSAVVMDFETGEVLFEKDADAVIPPASLTKLFAIHVACLEEAAGAFSFSDEVDLPPETWARNQEPGSSLMFLGEGQRVTYGELIEGLAVQSGNDAAVALALNVAGSIDAFAAMMNQAAADLGLVATRFVEPSGLSEQNATTAREMALFSRAYLSLWPENLDRYHALREAAHPGPENLPVNAVEPAIVQRNRNLLLFERDDVDGLKTGYIDESGYNLALTAEQDGRRLVVILLGVDGSDHSEGGRRRAEEGAALLDWAFGAFTNLSLGFPPLDPVPVYGGSIRELAVGPQGPIRETVPVEQAPLIRGKVELPEYFEAPVARGAQVGRIVYTAGEHLVREEPILALDEVEEGGFFRRMWDGIRLFFRNLF